MQLHIRGKYKNDQKYKKDFNIFIIFIIQLYVTVS